MHYGWNGISLLKDKVEHPVHDRTLVCFSHQVKMVSNFFCLCLKCSFLSQEHFQEHWTCNTPDSGTRLVQLTFIKQNDCSLSSCLMKSTTWINPMLIKNTIYQSMDYKKTVLPVDWVVRKELPCRSAGGLGLLNWSCRAALDAEVWGPAGSTSTAHTMWLSGCWTDQTELFRCKLKTKVLLYILKTLKWKCSAVFQL